MPRAKERSWSRLLASAAASQLARSAWPVRPGSISAKARVGAAGGGPRGGGAGGGDGGKGGGVVLCEVVRAGHEPGGDLAGGGDGGRRLGGGAGRQVAEGADEA